MSLFGKTDDSDNSSIIEELRRTIVSSNLPDHVHEVVKNELDTLSKINSSTTEFTIGLTYIEYALSLPWNSRTQDNLDLKRAERILNERHYGLDKIKRRIIEHLAVKILRTTRTPRILVVDDEPIALENMEIILKKEGYIVDTAQNGLQAVNNLKTSYFDVVLTDLKMNMLDGIGLLERVKSKSPDTQVIVITGYASLDTAIESIKKGGFHYIQKPVRSELLRSTVRDALEVKQTAKTMKGSVLCFAGPPGTGKTSLGKAVAEALGRKFSRISLGGIKDEAEIRGHRRTYAGAMPGRIIEEIRRAGVINPVLMLDELDKIGQDFKGDSSSALLEVLDPEQNQTFIDHYLDMSFDLSNVMFIGTANIADNIQGPLCDRMEIIEFSGYTEDEKTEIALQYLVPKQVYAKGLSDIPPEFTAESISTIIHEYTREAGIRGLEREIASVCRKIATDIVHSRNHTKNMTVSPDLIKKFLGPRKYYVEVAEEKSRIGVATGLVWTESGGSIIFIEAVHMKGSGELILTGSLGDVMRESAQAALSYIRSNAESFEIDDNFFKSTDIHIHVPAGAIPKDGPSAGATIAMALVSLFTGKAAKKDVAVTGEITLTGRILPVGGIREKLLAAKQAGVKTIIIPAKNRVEIDSLPDAIKKALDIHFADNLKDIIDLVLVS
ncbi:MAG: endopeptidase La [Nitrospiraceae bacterium]|nr:MAG: endopeptidase La [Nitrospiraceae bacterium]